MQRPRVEKLASWGLAIAALAFVVGSCQSATDAGTARPRSTRSLVTREEPHGVRGNGAIGSCVLHVRTGDVRIPASECMRLECEPGVASAFTGARPRVVLALLVLYALGTLAWAARWRALLAFADIELSLAEVWCLTVEAQAGGILLPGGIGGDALG